MFLFLQKSNWDLMLGNWRPGLNGTQFLNEIDWFILCKWMNNKNIKEGRSQNWECEVLLWWEVAKCMCMCMCFNITHKIWLFNKFVGTPNLCYFYSLHSPFLVFNSFLSPTVKPQTWILHSIFSHYICITSLNKQPSMFIISGMVSILLPPFLNIRSLRGSG